MSVTAIHRRLKALANPADATAAERYFKTGPGEYAEGDRFLGVRVPAVRAVARDFASSSLTTVARVLQSRWHEERLLALIILVRRYDRGTEADRARIYRLYMRSLRRINNWDLVDSSAPHIVGRHLAGAGRTTLTRLARSRHLWSRRVAMLATLHTIRLGDFADTLYLAELLLTDRHDLMHKAVGWMLREVGERDRAVLERFLSRHAAVMPRTMLRYAIEKFPAAVRKRYLAIKAAPASAGPGRARRGASVPVHAR